MPSVPPPETLSAIARRALTGDGAAFEELHRRLGGGLKKFLGRRLNKSDDTLLEELAQQVWVIAWEALDEQRYDPDRAAFSTFLYAIGHNISLRYLREAERRHRLTDKVIELHPRDEGGADPTLEYAELLDQAAQVELLDRALRSADLTEEELAIVEGIADGDSERAIAASLDLPPSTVHVRKKRLLKKLRTLLRDDTSSPEKVRKQDLGPGE